MTGSANLLELTTAPYPQNRDYASVIEAAFATGNITPPFIIMKAKRHMAKWYDTTIVMDSDTQIAVSDSDYSNDSIFLRWLKHFNWYTKESQHGAVQMLLLSGHGSHLTYDFIEYADANDIVIFVFPPHSTHLLQPLNVNVFGPYKHFHAKAVAESVRDGSFEFDKQDFLQHLRGIRHNTFKCFTIQSAFAKTGIWPYNPQVVLSKLPHVQEPTPSTPTRLWSYDLTTADTPTTAGRLFRHANCLQYKIKDYESMIDPAIVQGVEKLTKAAVAEKQAHMS